MRVQAGVKPLAIQYFKGVLIMTGFDFWRELITDYSYSDALRLANCYLDMQAKRVKTDHDEMIFCRELYAATQGTVLKGGF